MLSVLVIIWLLLWTHYVSTNEHKRTTSIIRKDLIASNVEPSDYSPIFTSRCSDIYENVVTRSVGSVSYTHLDVYKRQHLSLSNLTVLLLDALNFLQS